MKKIIFNLFNIFKIVFITRKLQAQGKSERINQIQHVFEKLNHIFIVYQYFELNLQDILELTGYEGLALSDISFFAKQILQVLLQLKKINQIHGSLNCQKIVFQNKNQKDIKVTNFGFFSIQEQYYFKTRDSRFYRPPESLIGAKCNDKVDLWSLGCILAEMYLGQPLFSSYSQYDQLRQIISLLGYPSSLEIQQCKYKDQFFKKDGHIYELKTQKEYEQDENVIIEQNEDLLDIYSLNGLMKYYDSSSFRTQDEKEILPYFIDFLKKLLKVDVYYRMNAEQALNHPFITQQYDEIQKASDQIDPLINVKRQKSLQPKLLGTQKMRNSCQQGKQRFYKKNSFVMAASDTNKRN